MNYFFICRVLSTKIVINNQQQSIPAQRGAKLQTISYSIITSDSASYIIVMSCVTLFLSQQHFLYTFDAINGSGGALLSHLSGLHTY